MAWMILTVSRPAAEAQDVRPSRVDAWTTSRVQGSPDPPLPYAVTRVFSNVELTRPTEVVWVSSADRWVGTHDNSKVVAFRDDPENATIQTVIDLAEAFGKFIYVTYSVSFHPDLEHHPWMFVTFSSELNSDEGVHLARLRVTDPKGPTVDPDSLTVLASWSSTGHQGGPMLFGPDGMFYFAIGDGQRPYPPDERDSGQDLSNLQSAIMRIDITNPTREKPYRIPSDNPFVGQPNARGEIWAFGLRNPWKMTFHPGNGDLLAADVGWEMREMVHRIVKGRNFGWSIMEGDQLLKPGIKPAIPITPPLFQHTHLDSRSITGGHYWQSDRIPQLKGAYLYGDFTTGKIWALKHKGDQLLWQKELVDTPLQVVAFISSPTGEVMPLAYDGTIWQLQPNPVAHSTVDFPRRLSETGLFSDVSRQQPAPGVIEYQINAPHWADGTHSRQWVAVPGNGQLGVHKRDDWKTGAKKDRFDFPENSVLAKTVSYLTVADDPQSERRIETQLLHRYLNDWRAYNYVWNDSQTDAVLQDDVATEQKLVIKDSTAAGGSRTQTWRHASRSECILCHGFVSGTVNGFRPPQLNINTGNENQLDQLARLGLFAVPVPTTETMVSPHDVTQPVESRARSWLSVNCSTCHRQGGGGLTRFRFSLNESLEENNFVNVAPVQGTFGLSDARVVAPGDPLRSVLIYRTLKSGRGHMPQFGSSVTDVQGVRLVHDWIASMPASEPTSPATQSIQNQIDSLQWVGDPEAKIVSLLASTPGAMALSLFCGSDSVHTEMKALIVKLGTEHSDTLVRDLFEHYLPEDQRVKRLGPTPNTKALLAMKGSAERGRYLFEQAKDVNCRACHRIGQVGKLVGPDLGGIGTQRRPDEILTSILKPSDQIDPRFRARQIVTLKGRVHVGIVVEETEKGVSLVDAAGKNIVVAVKDIDIMETAQKSAMPEQLLAGMTAEQAADLLAYLGSQQQPGPQQHRQANIQRASGPIVIDGKRDDPAWGAAPSVSEFIFTWWNKGDLPKQQTDARMLWDDQYLYVSYVCTDSDIQATHTQRDSDVFRDDCVEIFASPEVDHPERYFNLEMNALAAQLDAYRPAGTVGQPPRDAWDPDGIQVAVSIDGTINDNTDIDRGWSLEAAIPFRLFRNVLPAGRPKAGDQWRLNLNRLDSGSRVKSQWSQGNRNFPKFHDPDYFGFVEFAP